MTTLTQEQQQAAYATTSIAVTAGAGTGKTHMLAERYLFHVLEQEASPLEIVALTFTDKATAELRSRIRKTLQARLDENRFERLAELDASFIGTFHALCAKICRDYPQAAGVPGDFEVLDTLEGSIWQAESLEGILRNLPLELYERLPYSLMKSLMLDLLVDPLSAEAALDQPSDLWPGWIEEARARAKQELLAHPAWVDAKDTLSAFEGDAEDKVEHNRRLMVQAMTDYERGNHPDEALAVMAGISLERGSKKFWSHGGLDEVRASLKVLREAVRDAMKEGLVDLAWGPYDDDLKDLLPKIREAFGRVRAELRQEKRKAKVLDFADLEEYALRALRNDPAVCESYGQQWRIFLVDEFQDTNPVQAELLEYLSKNAQITLVGDEKQSIYGFRQADVECFRAFQSRVETQGGARLSISKSFRTHQALVQLTNQVFEPLLAESYQALEAHRREIPHDGPHIRAYGVDADKSMKKHERQWVEARFIARELRRMLDEGLPVHDPETQSLRPVRPGDIAVLARNWDPLSTYVEVFREFDLPAVHAGGGSLLDTREAKDVWALIRFLAVPADNLALAAVLRSPFFAVRDSVLQRFSETLPERQSWWEALQQCTESELVLPTQSLGQLLQAARVESPIQVLQLANRLTGYTAVLRYLPGEARRRADWDGMLDLVQRLSYGAGDLFMVFRRIQKLLKHGVKVPRLVLEPENAIALMTLHGAKGLEWPVVVLPDLTRKGPTHRGEMCLDAELGLALKIEDEAGNLQKPALYKLIDAHQTRREEAEALRLLYVAFTRARDHLILAATDLKGESLDRLKPGLDAAGIPVETIPEDAVSVTPWTFKFPQSTGMALDVSLLDPVEITP